MGDRVRHTVRADPFSRVSLLLLSCSPSFRPHLLWSKPCVFRAHVLKANLTAWVCLPAAGLTVDTTVPSQALPLASSVSGHLSGSYHRYATVSCHELLLQWHVSHVFCASGKPRGGFVWSPAKVVQGGHRCEEKKENLSKFPGHAGRRDESGRLRAGG